MVITKPTIDDFSDTTVMRVIRKIVEYIIDTLVPAINEGGGSSYVLPPATKSTLGGIIVGDNLTVDGSGKVNAPAPYTLPVASANTLGGVKIGNGVSVGADGTISVNASGGNVVMETLNIESLPTDFSPTDILILELKQPYLSGTIVNPQSWDGTISNHGNITNSGKGTSHTVIGGISNIHSQDLYFDTSSTNYIVFYKIVIYSYSNWNGSGALISVDVAAFNGNNKINKSINYTRTDIGNIVNRIRRIKVE